MMKEYNIKNLSEKDRKEVYKKIALETMVQKKVWDSSSSLDEAIEVYLELKNKMNSSDSTDNKNPDTDSFAQKKVR